MMYRLCLAPMVGVTTTHMRYLFRLISPNITLFTEMMGANTLLHAQRRHAQFLRFHCDEKPVVAQIAVREPKQAAACARLLADAGFDGININAGCPSKAVQHMGCGVLLMHEPARTADCIAAIRSACTLPISVKCRIGIDAADDAGFLYDFLQHVHDAGCRTVIIHARKALLRGLNPKQNRTVPPIDYARVYAAKAQFPSLHIVLNGEIKDSHAAQMHLHRVDGVMIGRAFEGDPMCAAQIAADLFDETPRSHDTVFFDYLHYIEEKFDMTQPLGAVFLLKPLFGFYRGRRDAKRWRSLLTDMMRTNRIDIDALRCGMRSYAY